MGKKIKVIIQEARDLCPEAEEYYPVTRELFDQELWKEIKTYWLETGSTLSKEIVWQLVKEIRLESLKTKKGITDDDADAAVIKSCEYIESVEELELLYTIPYQFMEEDLRYDLLPQRHHQYWHVRWMDVVPGYRQTIAGSMFCAPFFTDPPVDETLTLTPRVGWKLRDHSDNPIGIQCMRLGAGLNERDITLQEMTRCIIPTIGILSKYHPGNKNSVLKRTMLRLERQVRTWNKDDKSDPNEWEVSDVLHRRGGWGTHPKVIEALQREGRWFVEH